MTGTAPNYVLNFTIPRGATGESGTYTGPLMPTTNYWQSLTSGILPSGGTWAYVSHTETSDDNSGYTNNYVGVAAGGTRIGLSPSGGGNFCWRIQ